MKRLMAIAMAALLALTGAAGAAQTGAGGENFAGWMTQAVIEWLNTNMDTGGGAIESMDVSLPAAYTPPEGYDAFDISLPNQNLKGEKVFLLITFSKEGRAVSRTNAIASVKVRRPVAVAARPIERGRLLTAEDITIETRITGPFADDLAADAAQAVGRAAERAMRAGAPVRKSYLATPKLVRAGDMVKLVAARGAMRISVLAQAREDGNEGDWVKVVNLESNKAVTARVSGPGEATVDF
ncbi:MAG: flagellar basal body P-ring formation protein FlgA [Nitrospinae bacterium]|nr:flagellar basal body P-ring formation protein FlgA [Nitrospinota bacterium]